MTARLAYEAMLRYLRVEQRTIPHDDDDFDDPLPDALVSMNTALQQIFTIAPLFSAKQQRSAYFRAPADFAVEALSDGGMTCGITVSDTDAAFMLGCKIQLPDDDNTNRIVKIGDTDTGVTTVTLQFPHMSTTADGTATVFYDAAVLPADVITVHGPVAIRGGVAIESANGLLDLDNTATRSTRYFIESNVTGGTVLRNIMRLNAAPTEATVIEFQARTAPPEIVQADIYTGDGSYVAGTTTLPIPSSFIESIFLPLALNVFFTKPCVTNFDQPGLRNSNSLAGVADLAKTALLLLERMRPQGSKRTSIKPGW